MKNCLIRIGYVLAFLVAGAGTAVAAELVMFESDSCEWCEIWHKEIGPIYPKTEESQLAPLRRVSIEDPVPADLSHLKAVMFTPTFVLMENGKEVGRITGYPGEDFFWPLLAEQLDKLAAAPRAKPAAACVNKNDGENSDEKAGLGGISC